MFRYFRTRVCDCLSFEAELISGEVQDSDVRPLAFLIYVDLAKLLESRNFIAKLFADDVKVYLKTTNVCDSVTSVFTYFSLFCYFDY